jgi:hypothetical protein
MVAFHEHGVVAFSNQSVVPSGAHGGFLVGLWGFECLKSQTVTSSLGDKAIL